MSCHGRTWTQLLSLGAVACGEGSNLAVSGGAPVMAAVQGTITDCGKPMGGVAVRLQIQQDRPEQARPVNTEVSVTTDRQGRYFVEVGPPFAVPGDADVQLQVSQGRIALEVVGELEFSLGHAARDTARLDADLGRQKGVC